MADTEKSKTDISNRRALRPGEWACVDAKCAHINAEKRHSCEICGKAKPKAKSKIGREIGKDAAEKSKGLFSAEDWVCTKCGNVNWARRNTCNVCNAPKLADLEIRTGYGGGYMDRQDVEYKDRRDDEEEFDEFGRKKKKRNTENEQKSSDPFSEELSEDSLRKHPDEEKKVFEDEEDGEDEESDEGDLDKYDLTADPELAALTATLESSKAKVIDAPISEKRPPSPMSSDCSCSCSGGDCSCIESEEEEAAAKKIRTDRAASEKRRSVDRDRGYTRDRRDDKDRKEDRHRDEFNEKSSANKNKDRDHRDRRSKERSRERRRSRERDHRR